MPLQPENHFLLSIAIILNRSTSAPLAANPLLAIRYSFPSFRYSKMSPGWQSNALHIASVLKRIALAFPVFSIKRLDNGEPTL